MNKREISTVCESLFRDDSDSKIKSGEDCDGCADDSTDSSVSSGVPDDLDWDRCGYDADDPDEPSLSGCVAGENQLQTLRPNARKLAPHRETRCRSITKCAQRTRKKPSGTRPSDSVNSSDDECSQIPLKPRSKPGKGRRPRVPYEVRKMLEQLNWYAIPDPDPSGLEPEPKPEPIYVNIDKDDMWGATAEEIEEWKAAQKAAAEVEHVAEKSKAESTETENDEKFWGLTIEEVKKLFAEQKEKEAAEVEQTAGECNKAALPESDEEEGKFWGLTLDQIEKTYPPGQTVCYANQIEQKTVPTLDCFGDIPKEEQKAVPTLASKVVPEVEKTKEVITVQPTVGDQPAVGGGKLEDNARIEVKINEKLM